MSKSKKVKSKRSGTQYSKHIRIINSNPVLKNIKCNYINDLEKLREEILNKCLEEIDIIKDEAERKLIYDKSEKLNISKELAKKNPDKFIKLLRTATILNEEGYNPISYRFMEISNSILKEKFENIVIKTTPLKATSVVQTIYEFHNNILKINMNILKHLLYDELDSTCLEFIKTYEIPGEEKKEYNLDKFNEIKEPLPFNLDENEDLNTTRDFKMRSFKELNDLATKNGFKFKRQRGDHAIFRNSNGYITVIPQRSLGKGLQIEILKQIGEY